MTAVVLQLDDFRKKIREDLVCLFCGARGQVQIIPGRRYYDCPKDQCEETAAVPEERWS